MKGSVEVEPNLDSVLFSTFNLAARPHKTVRIARLKKRLALSQRGCVVTDQRAHPTVSLEPFGNLVVELSHHVINRYSFFDAMLLFVMSLGLILVVGCARYNKGQ